jgi:hypothetical protein
MKLIVATFSLLVLLGLSGSIVALVGGRSGLLGKQLSFSEFGPELKVIPEGWAKALRCWRENEAPADCPQW